MAKTIKEDLEESLKRAEKIRNDTDTIHLESLSFISNFVLESQKIAFENSLKNLDFIITLLSTVLSISFSVLVAMISLPQFKGNANSLITIILCIVPEFIFLVIIRVYAVHKYSKDIEKTYEILKHDGIEIYAKRISDKEKDLNIIVTPQKTSGK